MRYLIHFNHGPSPEVITMLKSMGVTDFQRCSEGIYCVKMDEEVAERLRLIYKIEPDKTGTINV